MVPPSPTCDSCGAINQPRARFCRACGRPLQAIKPGIYNSATGQLLPNILLKQRYRIIKLVGQGGFGAVYQAEDTQLGNRQVALKEMSQSSMNPQKQKEVATVFEQEAIILARLQHPNLPSIFDHFEENSRWYLVMSFIKGETLEDYLSSKEGGKLPLDEVVDIGAQLCVVLDYLHNQQPPIIFRDLKPANIMRTLDGHIYLIDFGIARHFKSGQSKDTTYIGSPGYASPEQYGRAQTTPASDIYSLGATLHQLLSGHDPSSTPFRFPSLHLLAPSVPAPLALFITQMLEMDEAKRPANISLVKQGLQTPPQTPPLSSYVAPGQRGQPHTSQPTPGQSATYFTDGQIEQAYRDLCRQYATDPGITIVARVNNDDVGTLVSITPEVPGRRAWFSDPSTQQSPVELRMIGGQVIPVVVFQSLVLDPRNAHWKPNGGPIGEYYYPHIIWIKKEPEPQEPEPKVEKKKTFIESIFGGNTPAPSQPPSEPEIVRSKPIVIEDNRVYFVDFRF